MISLINELNDVSWPPALLVLVCKDVHERIKEFYFPSSKNQGSTKSTAMNQNAVKTFIFATQLLKIQVYVYNSGMWNGIKNGISYFLCFLPHLDM